MSDLYRDFIDQKADQIINSLGGTITPAPANAELYRDFLDRKFDDVINAITGFNPVKSFTYKGTGTYPFTLKFPTVPKLILSITGVTNGAYKAFMYPVPYGYSNYIQYYCTTTGTNSGSTGGMLTFNNDEVTLESSQNGAGRVFNVLDQDYTVYYI